VEITVWNIDPDTEREDLASPLSENGTGIGQVLAILYVVITASTPKMIIIDEPNTFLHPRALRKLMEIIRDASLPHQYVLTTHSSEVIAKADPSFVYLVKWADGESRLEVLSSTSVHDLRRALDEVGVRLSDVFGADAIVWVEGPTEAACFPAIVKAFDIDLPPNTQFIGLRETGDFLGKRRKVIAEIYHSLTTANALMPPTIAFSFDDEQRSDSEKDDMRKMIKGKVNFLPRRMYENYLLNPKAIAEILGESATSARVDAWIQEHGGEQKYRADDTVVGGKLWLRKVYGANLLADLCAELSNATLEYQKTKHSVELTDWLLKHERDSLTELADYVRGILESSPLPPTPHSARA
jgi:hypothetical protein